MAEGDHLPRYRLCARGSLHAAHGDIADVPLNENEVTLTLAHVERIPRSAS